MKGVDFLFGEDAIGFIYIIAPLVIGHIVIPPLQVHICHIFFF